MEVQQSDHPESIIRAMPFPFAEINDNTRLLLNSQRENIRILANRSIALEKLLGQMKNGEFNSSVFNKSLLDQFNRDEDIKDIDKNIDVIRKNIINKKTIVSDLTSYIYGKCSTSDVDCATTSGTLSAPAVYQLSELPSGITPGSDYCESETALWVYLAGSFVSPLEAREYLTANSSALDAELSSACAGEGWYYFIYSLYLNEDCQGVPEFEVITGPVYGVKSDDTGCVIDELGNSYREAYFGYFDTCQDACDDLETRIGYDFCGLVGACPPP